MQGPTLAVPKAHHCSKISTYLKKNARFISIIDPRVGLLITTGKVRCAATCPLRSQDDLSADLHN